MSLYCEPFVKYNTRIRNCHTLTLLNTKIDIVFNKDEAIVVTKTQASAVLLEQ